MLKKIAFAVCFSAKILALTCSNPVTLSTPGHDCRTPAVAMNENGDVAAIWKVEDEVTDDEYVYTAVKKKGGEWGPSSLFANNIGRIRVKLFKLDPSSHVQAVLKLRRSDVDGLFQWSEKKWGDFLPTVIEYARPFPYFYSATKAFNDKGKWVCIGTVSEGSSNSKKIVVTTVSPGQSDIVYNTLGSTDSLWLSARNIIFDSKGRAVVVWRQEERDTKSYKTIYSLKMARENEDGSWSLPETVCKEFDYVYFVEMQADAQGNIALAWVRDGSLYAMSQQDGKWSEPVLIGPSEQDPHSPRMSFDKEGNLLAVWKGTLEKQDVIYAAYKPIGRPWQPSALITPINIRSWAPRVQTDNRGNFVLIWKQAVTKKVSTIHGMTFSAQQEKWSAPVQLSPAGQNCRKHNFTFSGDGKGALSWILVDKCHNRFVQVADLIVD